MYTRPDIFLEISSLHLPVSRWTSVPLHNDLLNHLLLLFWTWDMIGNRAIDRTMFEEDMKSQDPDSSQSDDFCFCSPLLVNAMLALSCVRIIRRAVMQSPLLIRGSYILQMKQPTSSPTIRSQGVGLSKWNSSVSLRWREVVHPCLLRRQLY
jgi:hypothetical protein